MRHHPDHIELVADEDLVYEDNWALFDQEEYPDFFPEDTRSLRSYTSEDGRYRTAFATRESTTIDGVTEPTGICLIKDEKVVSVTETIPVDKAIPANDGSVVAIGRDATQFIVFDPTGKLVLEEEFESNAGPITISPDGRFAAVTTAFPDNAVHLYDINQREYLGRKENPSTTVIKFLEFEEVTDGYVVNTYDIHPESSLASDVDPGRTEIIDQIPAAPISNSLELDGAGIVVEGETWHHIQKETLEDVSSDLRIPGVTLDTSCGQVIEPLHADLIFREVQQARQSQYEICSDCKSGLLSYPTEKVEKQGHKP